jgi:hypothetical protein
VIDDTSARGTRWFRRRLLSTSDLAKWGADDWADWFADGLDIWFSNAAITDRALSFAPMRMTPDRDEMAEAVANFLTRFYHPEFGPPPASQTLDIIDTIEEGASICIRSNPLTCVRADFLLEVFEMLHARRLGELAKLSLQQLQPSAFDVRPDADEYISRLAYIILDTNAVRDGDALQDLVEDRLRRSENYRSALSYSLQLSTDDVLLAMTRFYDLTEHAPEMEAEDIWEDVAQELDSRFGRSSVVAAIQRASTTSMDDMDGIGGILPAMRLRAFYKELDGMPADLFAIADDEPSGNEKALAKRDIVYEAIP